MKELPKFSEQLIGLMQENDNITTDKLGDAIGVAGSVVRKWRAGKSSPTLANTIRLAEYFSCSLDYLAGRTENDFEYTPKPVLPFHEQILSILKERSLSWYKVVKDTKISASNMRDWKRGCSPLLPRLIELADYLDITIDCLIGRDR